ncbi:MAG: hypothetical protein DMD97_03960 [Candidatus Rokuibacteriota bacterium]|nr:MAG: hypothetical protein DMD97_03960 [Candidatus Rokubacteria bacterium]
MRASVAVADSWAILALMRGEGEAGRTMRRLLQRARSGNLRLTPIELVPVKEPLVLAAARIKARHPLSYADAFAVATARMERAPVVTGDPEICSLPSDVVRVRRLQR